MFTVTYSIVFMLVCSQLAKRVGSKLTFLRDHCVIVCFRNCFSFNGSGSEQSHEMALLQVGSLVAVLLIVSVAVTNGQTPKPSCFIPEGHYDGEPVKYYDPEPRSG